MRGSKQERKKRWNLRYPVVTSSIGYNLSYFFPLYFKINWTQNLNFFILSFLTNFHLSLLAKMEILLMGIPTLKFSVAALEKQNWNFNWVWFLYFSHNLKKIIHYWGMTVYTYIYMCWWIFTNWMLFLWHSHYCSFSSLGSSVKSHILRETSYNHPIQSIKLFSIRVVLEVWSGDYKGPPDLARGLWGQNGFHNNTKSFFVFSFSFPYECTVEFSRSYMMGDYISLMATNGMRP